MSQELCSVKCIVLVRVAIIIRFVTARFLPVVIWQYAARWCVQCSVNSTSQPIQSPVARCADVSTRVRWVDATIRFADLWDYETERIWEYGRACHVKWGVGQMYVIKKQREWTAEGKCREQKLHDKYAVTWMLSDHSIHSQMECYSFPVQ